MNYYGGNERSSSGSSSSRKGKKSGSDKPKQPQRGLGVAQLEKIRLHSQMGFLPQEDIRMQTPYSSSSSSPFSYNSPSTAFNSFQGTHSHMMGMSELDRTNYVYGESHIASINPRWDASSAILLEAQRYAEPIGISSRHLFSPELLEDSLRKKTRKDQNDSMGSSSQNSDSNGSHELDLELRLAL